MVAVVVWVLCCTLPFVLLSMKTMRCAIVGRSRIVLKDEDCYSGLSFLDAAPVLVS